MADIYGDFSYSWIFIDTHWYLWRCMDFYGYVWIRMDIWWLVKPGQTCSPAEKKKIRIYKVKPDTSSKEMGNYSSHYAGPKPLKLVPVGRQKGGFDPNCGYGTCCVHQKVHLWTWKGVVVVFFKLGSFAIPNSIFHKPSSGDPPFMESPKFGLPSGKLLHNYRKIHHFEWVNPLFLWPFSIANC